uniref:Outer membrane protein beta-barrel domain-containing protein n=1 Tax=candidate division WOR-3 bacterium TaxID=2052148 RepID=A0A7C4CC00_UNCW3
MKRLSALVLSIALAASSAAAGKHGSTSGGFGCFGPTLAFVDFSGLNSALAAHGSGQLSTMHWTFGGAGYAFVNRIVLGGAGWGGSQNLSLRSDSLLCRVSFSGGQFDVGYSLLDLKHLLVAPTLGIGAAGYDIELQPVESNVPNFDSLLVNPGRTSTVSTTSFSLVPQLVITIPVSFVGLQVKGGYCFAPGSHEWKLADGARLAKGPELAKGTPFVSLSVVFGGLGRERKTRIKAKAEGQSKPEQETEPEDND